MTKLWTNCGSIVDLCRVWAALLFVLHLCTFFGGALGFTSPLANYSSAVLPLDTLPSDVNPTILERLISHAITIQRIGRKSVCYGHLGCFHVTGRFSNFRRIPDPPGRLATRFLLCTRINPKCDDGSSLLMDEDGSVSQLLDPGVPGFVFHAPIKVIIHGYSGRYNHPQVRKLRIAFLKKEDCNVILVDWDLAARGPTYMRSVANAELVGRQAAHVLGALVGLGASARDIHVVGFSLGAQIAGFVGEGLKAQNIKLGRITGLDPASMLFERTNLDTARKLDRSDAELVDVVHTDGSLVWVDGFGILGPVGHVDFFPNGGLAQPGCSDTYVDVLAFRFDQRPNTNRSCSHARSIELFMESMQPECKFVGFACPGLKDFDRHFVHGNCFSCDSGSCATMGHTRDDAEHGLAGGWSGGPGKGPLFFVTRKTKPYCGQQVRVAVFLSPRTRAIRGYLEVILFHGNTSTSFDLNSKIYPLSRTMETLVGGQSASSIVALKSGSLSVHKTPTLRVAIKFKPTAGMARLGPIQLFIDKVTVTNQEGEVWYHCGEDTLLENSRTSTFGELELNLDMDAC